MLRHVIYPRVILCIDVSSVAWISEAAHLADCLQFFYNNEGGRGAVAAKCTASHSTNVFRQYFASNSRWCLSYFHIITLKWPFIKIWRSRGSMCVCVCCTWIDVETLWIGRATLPIIFIWAQVWSCRLPVIHSETLKEFISEMKRWALVK